MAEAVYILCAAMSLACAVLLFRGYRRSDARLLLWSSLCFVGLTANNALLFVDLVIVPDLDLRLLRGAASLVAVAVLLFGFIWEPK